MASLCKNCGAPLVFDPESQKMVCNYCASYFNPEEVETDERDSLLNKDAESMNDIYGTDDKDLLDCYIYTCNHCGGEIIINGTEASTNCIYCGNSTVVFSRIAKQKKPSAILPFRLTKDDAIRKIHETIDKGFFIPKEIKNFKADSIRGIYIPYWIVDAEHADAVVVKGTVKSGKSSQTVYYGRAGTLYLKDLPLDASTLLSDESSSRLEPFNLSELKMFDEDYLMGFYSNVTDVTFGDLRQAVYSRADDYFKTSAIADVKGPSGKKIYTSSPHTAIQYDTMKYAMLPAWFVTFDYQGKHNTILVNGQTGKVVCGLPWNKKLFWIMLIVIGILATIAATIILYYTLPFIFSSKSKSSSSSSNNGKLFMALIFGVIALFSTGIHNVRKTIKSINLTQSQSIFNFVKKRQE